jgi:hypothetical protein
VRDQMLGIERGAAFLDARLTEKGPRIVSTVNRALHNWRSVASVTPPDGPRIVALEIA